MKKKIQKHRKEITRRDIGKDVRVIEKKNDYFEWDGTLIDIHKNTLYGSTPFCLVEFSLDGFSFTEYFTRKDLEVIEHETH